MTRVPRGGGSQEGTTGDLLSHQPEFLGTPLNYYELRESHQKSTRVRGEGHQKWAISSGRTLRVLVGPPHHSSTVPPRSRVEHVVQAHLWTLVDTPKAHSNSGEGPKIRFKRW